MANCKRVLDKIAASWVETAKGMASQEATSVCTVGEEEVPGSQVAQSSDASSTTSSV